MLLGTGLIQRLEMRDDVSKQYSSPGLLPFLPQTLDRFGCEWPQECAAVPRCELQSSRSSLTT